MTEYTKEQQTERSVKYNHFFSGIEILNIEYILLHTAELLYGRVYVHVCAVRSSWLVGKLSQGNATGSLDIEKWLDRSWSFFCFYHLNESWTTSYCVVSCLTISLGMEIENDKKSSLKNYFLPSVIRIIAHVVCVAYDVTTGFWLMARPALLFPTLFLDFLYTWRRP